jgi:hypothetical protein
VNRLDGCHPPGKSLHQAARGIHCADAHRRQLGSQSWVRYAQEQMFNLLSAVIPWRYVFSCE